MKLRIKRVYDEPSSSDGLRILVDRLWPRGLTKEKAGIDLWMKEIAPSQELREWFAHDPAKWEEFEKRYHHELDKNASELETLRQHLAKGQVTLVYGAKDTEHNQAVTLLRYLEKIDV